MTHTPHTPVAILVALLLLGSGATSYGQLGANHGGDRWSGNYFPNVILTDHEGNKVRFYDDLVKGKVVVINFIYTSCPDSCPLETAKLSEVQGILGDRVGKDFHFYSISIDPVRDTPEVLAEYREIYGAKPGWSFYTGSEHDIIVLRKKLGIYNDDAEEGDEYDHATSLVLGNQPLGRWVNRSPFENAYVLASQIEGWLTNWKTKPNHDRDYRNAPKLRRVSTGENLFRTRCAVCHVISADPEARGKGPNLFGVTERREYAWLGRWISEPDKVLAEKDPIAMSLFEAYDELAMPNLRLERGDVEALIGFLGAETRRVKAAAVSGRAVEKAKEKKKETDDCCQKQLGNAVATPEPVAPEAAGLGGGFHFKPLELISMGLGACIVGVIIFLRLRERRLPGSAASGGAVGGAAQ